MIRVHGPADQRLAEPGRGVDHRFLAPAGHRVCREHHPRHVRVHHFLHDDGDRHRALVDPVICAVGHGPVRPQGSPAASDRIRQRVGTDDDEVGVQLACEAGFGEILGGG